MTDYSRPKRTPKKTKADVPYKPEAIAALGLDRDEGNGRPLSEAQVRERIAKRAAELADKGVRPVAEMASKSGVTPGDIEKHRRKK